MKITKWFKREINDNWPLLIYIFVWMVIIIYILMNKRVQAFCAQPLSEIKVGELIFIGITILMVTRK